MTTMPRATVILRLVAFAVAAGLAMAGVQPLIGAFAGSVGVGWAMRLTAPAVVTAALVFLAARLLVRGDDRQPPWYSAWLLFPGAFLLAGAAAMCIFGALIQLQVITWTMWALLASGVVTWSAGMAVVRAGAR